VPILSIPSKFLIFRSFSRDSYLKRPISGPDSDSDADFDQLLAHRAEKPDKEAIFLSSSHTFY